MNKIEMKNWLKENGALISSTRTEMKNKMRSGSYAGSEQWKLQCDKAEYRNYHIAYSLSNGKTYKEIEKTVRKDNEPNWNTIDSILLNELGIIPEEIR